MHVIPSLNMNMANILANDAPLLSPTAADWDHARFEPSAALDGFGLELQYPLSPTPSHAMSTSSQQHSPIPAAMMLRGRLSPDYSDSDQQMCVPTHQVFDCPPAPVSPAPQPEILEQTPRVSLTVSPPPSVVPAKRSSSAAPSSSKKRATERVSTKDFIPPDVTGLSKREARLVKNRAAAFLSRQRKREEFENMEVYVSEFSLFSYFLLFPPPVVSFWNFLHPRPMPTLRIQRIPCLGRSINSSRWTEHSLAPPSLSVKLGPLYIPDVQKTCPVFPHGECRKWLNRLVSFSLRRMFSSGVRLPSENHITGYRYEF